MERVLLDRTVRPFRSLRSNVSKRGLGSQSLKPSGRLRTSAQTRSFSIVPLRSVSEGRCQTRAYQPPLTYDIALHELAGNDDTLVCERSFSSTEMGELLQLVLGHLDRPRGGVRIEQSL